MLLFDVGLDSFRSFVSLSQPWEAYVQGRKAIHIEYSNADSVEPKLKLTSISRWGARITTPTKRLVVEGPADEKERRSEASTITASLTGGFLPPKDTHVLHEVISPKADPNSMSPVELCQKILSVLEPIIKWLGKERFQAKAWSGWEFREYYNSLGSTMTSHFPVAKLKISVKTAEGGLIKRAGAREGVEFFEGITPGWIAEFMTDVENAKIAVREEYTPKVLILDPEAMAMFIHEGIGHASEGDNVLEGNSYLSGLASQRIASRDVTIADSPKDYPGLGSYPFDDEGVLAQTTLLVENGIVRGHLADRKAGAGLGAGSTGNCRSFWYDSTPRVRMSNLVMLPGGSSFETILRGTDEGLLVRGMKEGGCDERTGDFHFKPNVAYRIRNGEMGRSVAVPEIAGNARRYLRAITEVSREWSLTVAGCGKPTPQSDYSWVGYGAPFVKFKLD
jgi:predicted Zn-dependent protease